ncbi:MAG TPA: hypothetical protein DCS93_06455 [Microscillaceae bacterium]|nr:hypothetical protein [Microscillaceae bacterium]
MKPNVFYYLYEGIVFVLVVACCWDMWFTTQDSLSAISLTPLKRSLEYDVDRNYRAIREEYAKHKNDLHLNDNYELGRANLQRRDTLDSLLNIVIRPIDALKHQLEQMPLDDQAAVKRLMIDQKNAEQLEARMDRFVIQLQETFDDLLLSKFTKRSRYFSPNKKDLPKNLVYHYFEEATPMLATILLTEQQRMAMRYANEVAQKLNLRGLQLVRDEFNQMEVGLSNRVDVVKVGDFYTSDLFISKYQPLPQLQLLYNDRRVRHFYGKAMVDFKAQALGKKDWKAQFRYRKNGKDTTITHRVPYQVLK